MDALGLGARRAASTGATGARKLVAQYEGMAMVIKADGTVTAGNDKASPLVAQWDDGGLPGIRYLVQQVFQSGAAQSAQDQWREGENTSVIEATAMPVDRGRAVLLLGHDITMEHNLKTALADSRQRYKDLVDLSSDFGWEVGPEGTFVFVSPRGALGFSPDGLLGRRPADFVSNAGDYAPLPFAPHGPMEDVEVWMRRESGGQACLLVSAMPLRGRDGVIVGARGTCRDITVEREREATLAHAHHREQLIQYVLGTIRDEVEPGHMLEAAAGATARALGAAGCRIYRAAIGDGDGAASQRTAASYGDTDGLGDLEGFLGSTDQAKPIFDVDLGGWIVLLVTTRYRQTANGAIAVWKQAELGGWNDEDRSLMAEIGGQLGIAIEQIMNHERIVSLSRSDELTGLLNRRAFMSEDLPRRLSRLHRSGRLAALFYLDLDNFKIVNDTYGHRRGDEVLLVVRDLLIEHSRPHDVIARLGGDEFAMWLDGMGLEVARSRAQSLITASQRLRAFSGAPQKPLGLSAGVAVYDPRHPETLEDLFARADAAMYAVKRRGKGGFEIARPARPAIPPPQPD